MSNIETREPGHLYRQNNNVIFNKQKLPENNENEHLLSISCNKDQFFLNLNSFKIDENENICSINSSWFSLKNLKSTNNKNLFKINEGEVIKIGKIIIRVRKIKLVKNKRHKRNNSALNVDCLSSMSIDKINNLKEIGEFVCNNNHYFNNINNYSINNDSNSNKILDNNNENENKKENNIILSNNKNTNQSIILKEDENENKKKGKYNEEENYIKNSETSQKLCRICYLEEDNEKNPLIQPCLCSGSMKYIHLNCLKQWIGTRSCIKVENNEYCSIFLVKEIDCELCKNKLPDYIRHKNKLYKIIEFHTEFKNYLSFENLTLDKQKNKFIYVINLDANQKIKIGRGHESNILLSDISVSRVHCLLNIDNNNVYLEDNNSKYGTLVLVQTHRINLVETLSLNLQIGRTFINCKVKKPFKLFGCCEINEKIDSSFYYKQNEKQIGMKKVLTVKTELENNKIEDDSDKIEEIDIDVDEDVSLNRSTINFSKYNFRSNENCKNLLNSISYRKYDILSSIRKMNENSSSKNITRNEIMNEINNSQVTPITLRTGRI